MDEIAREQVTALRSRSLVSEFISRKRQGIFVSLKSEVGKMGEASFAGYCKQVSKQYLIPRGLLKLVQAVRTSLDRFKETEATALMYHAYLMTDAFLWCYRDTFAPEYQVDVTPNPKWLIEFSPATVKNWQLALKDSASWLALR